MNAFLNNILALSPNILLFLGVSFLVLALFWYNTGRLFLVGWVVKILWLPINAMAFCLWFFASVVNGIFDTIRGFSTLVWLVRGVLLLFDWYVWHTPELSVLIIPSFIISFIFFYLTKYGLPEGKISGWAKYSPKARKTPIKKPKLKPMKQEPAVEDLPKPEVKCLVKNSHAFETEVKIKSRLDGHLKRLISGGGDNE